MTLPSKRTIITLALLALLLALNTHAWHWLLGVPGPEQLLEYLVPLTMATADFGQYLAQLQGPTDEQKIWENFRPVTAAGLAQNIMLLLVLIGHRLLRRDSRPPDPELNPAAPAG